MSTINASIAMFAAIPRPKILPATTKMVTRSFIGSPKLRMKLNFVRKRWSLARLKPSATTAFDFRKFTTVKKLQNLNWKWNKAQDKDHECDDRDDLAIGIKRCVVERFGVSDL